MDHITASLIELIRALFERWGYLVVFLGILLENTLFLGLFVPGAFVLLLAGVTAYEGIIDWRTAFLLALLGTSLGDTFSYLAGRFGWRRALRRAEQLPFMGTVRSALMRRTGLFVLAYHFLGYTRVVGPVTAGALRIPFRRWYLLDLLGASVWVSAYFFGGVALARLGITLDSAHAHAQEFDRVLLLLGVLGGAGFLLLRMIRKRRRGAVLDPAAEEPEHSPLP